MKLDQLKVLFFVPLFCMTLSVQSQKVSVEIGGGFSGISHSIEKGKSTMDLGFIVGINCSYSLVEDRWSVVGGLQFGRYVNKISLDNDYQYLSNEVDGRGSAFQYRITTNEYKEEQSLYSINIPLLIQYTFYISRYSMFYISGGIKVITPVSQSVDSKANQLRITGYYPDVNLTVTDLSQHGFGTVTDWKGGQTPLKLSTSIVLSAQSGFDFYLGENLCYMGLYFDYGLNDISNSKRGGNIIAYNSGVLGKNLAKGVSNSSFVNSVKIKSLGVNFKVFF